MRLLDEMGIAEAIGFVNAASPDVADRLWRRMVLRGARMKLQIARGQLELGNEDLALTSVWAAMRLRALVVGRGVRVPAERRRGGSS